MIRTLLVELGAACHPRKIPFWALSATNVADSAQKQEELEGWSPRVPTPGTQRSLAEQATA